MNKKRSRDHSNMPLTIGGPSIIMVFAVLCLTTFGLLSLVSARSEVKLSFKNETSVQNYYHTQTAVEETIEQIDGILKNTPHAQLHGNILKQINQLEYTTAISTGRALQVTIDCPGKPVGILVRMDINENGTIHIIEYHAQNSGNTQDYDDGFEVWPGADTTD